MKDLKDIKKVVKNYANYLRGCIIILIVFNKKMPDAFLEFCQSTAGKIMFALTIAFLVYLESSLGLLMTVYFLFIMNEYNTRFKNSAEKFININENFNDLINMYEDLSQTCRHNYQL